AGITVLAIQNLLFTTSALVAAPSGIFRNSCVDLEIHGQRAGGGIIGTKAVVSNLKSPDGRRVGDGGRARHLAERSFRPQAAPLRFVELDHLVAAGPWERGHTQGDFGR